MIKKIINILLIISLVCLNVSVIFAANEPKDNISKDIKNINDSLQYLSEQLPYEGLYCHKIRDLLNTYNLPYIVDTDYASDPNYDAWFGYKKADNPRLITAKDLTIPPYKGPLKILSNAERSIAYDFSLNYICKTEADVMFELVSENLRYIQHIEEANNIKESIIGMFDAGLGGYYSFKGPETVKNLLLSMPEFNGADFVKNEDGYYTNSKFLEINYAGKK